MNRTNGNICAATQRKNKRPKVAQPGAQEQDRELHGVIPICSYCHQIRDDTHTWSRPHDDIILNEGAQFSHGICPACIPKVLEEYGLQEPAQD